MKQSERKKVQSILENIRKQHNILESLPEKEVFALLEENQGTIIELEIMWNRIWDRQHLLSECWKSIVSLYIRCFRA